MVHKRKQNGWISKKNVNVSFSLIEETKYKLLKQDIYNLAEFITVTYLTLAVTKSFPNYKFFDDGLYKIKCLYTNCICSLLI